MRIPGQMRMGYYPTPERITDLIRERFTFPSGPFAALDPCAGEGIALDQFTRGTQAATYGIELDDTRAGEAAERLRTVRHSAIEDMKVSHKAFSLLWLNPPYDWQAEQVDADGDRKGKCQRKELTFLRRAVPWLCPGGIMVYVIPESAWIEDIRRLIAYKFEDVCAFRFPDPEYEQFGQIVVVGKRAVSDMPRPAPVLRDDMGEFQKKTYILPITNPDIKIFQTNKVDKSTMEKLVSCSGLWTKFLSRSRGMQRGSAAGKRPPLPLHSGHLSLMLAAGVLDGVIGNNGDSHVIKGKVTKGLTTTTETHVNSDAKTETTVSTYRDDYQVSIKLLNRNGDIRELC